MMCSYQQCWYSYGGFLEWGYPNSWLVYKGKSPQKMDENWGYPYFRKPPYNRDNVGWRIPFIGTKIAFLDLPWALGFGWISDHVGVRQCHIFSITVMTGNGTVKSHETASALVKSPLPTVKFLPIMIPTDDLV